MRTAITGFHAIEERVRRADAESAKKMRLLVAKAGPRAKKIAAEARAAGIRVEDADERTLDAMAAALPETARDHRGLILEAEETRAANVVDFDLWAKDAESMESATVVILDSITDPHNVGAILRSADQFGASLVVAAAHRSLGDIARNEVVARASAGASASVPTAVVPNLVRAAGRLKEAGFWLYGADAGGKSVGEVAFAAKSAIVMGSEGSGISRLLAEQCDEIVSIPTCGTVDSLNVSVAAGILLYERSRQSRG